MRYRATWRWMLFSIFRMDAGMGSVGCGGFSPLANGGAAVITDTVFAVGAPLSVGVEVTLTTVPAGNDFGRVVFPVSSYSLYSPVSVRISSVERVADTTVP